MRKPANRLEKAHMELVKSMPCIICAPWWFDDPECISRDNWKNNPPSNFNTEYDHMVDGYRLGHMFGIPLCHFHHEGKKGYGPKEYHWDSSKRNQWLLLEKVYKVLGKEIPKYNPKGRNNFA